MSPKTILVVLMVVGIGSSPILSASDEDCRFLGLLKAVAPQENESSADIDAVLLFRSGKKYSIGPDYYFRYGFDKKPQIGMTIMKIQIFTKEGKQDTSFEITGNSGMPSMRGAHESGDQLFRRNKKGDYLFPINVVMPGDWEIHLNFLKGNKSVLTGRVRFHV